MSVEEIAATALQQIARGVGRERARRAVRIAPER
jgi:hypothetical protein